jgi:signal peptidase I
VRDRSALTVHLTSAYAVARPRISSLLRRAQIVLALLPSIRRLPHIATARRSASFVLDHIEAIAVVAVLAMLLTFTALDLSGNRLFVVSGASMEPAISHGSLIVVRPATPDAVAVGDVVTFQHRGATVTHRVNAIDDRAGTRVFTTKGDANEALDPDPVSFDDRVGLLVAQVPFAGYVLALLQWYGRPLSVGLGLVIAAWAIRRYRLRPFPVAVRT